MWNHWAFSGMNVLGFGLVMLYIYITEYLVCVNSGSWIDRFLVWPNMNESNVSQAVTFVRSVLPVNTALMESSETRC